MEVDIFATVARLKSWRGWIAWIAVAALFSVLSMGGRSIKLLRG